LGSEFKRWQAPPILKVSTHSFGRGRRWPIAQKIDL
jgi:NAD+ synthase (glutamine-hydrolysing)